MDTCRVAKGCMSNLSMGVTIAYSSNSIPQQLNLFVSQIMWTFSPQEAYVAEKCKNILQINIFLCPSGVASPKFLGAKSFEVGKKCLIDFRRSIVVCLGHLVSKKKKLDVLKIGGIAPWVPHVYTCVST